MAKLPEYVLTRLRFMVIDDDPHMRSMVINILRSFGVREIEEAEDGESAFERLKDFSPDIVFCDWQMGPMDGLAFTRRIRGNADSSGAFVPLIMITAHTEVGRVCTARDSGITEFLAKPISATTLYARICAVINRPRPFIRAKSFVGPDRRRRRDPYQAGKARRQEDQVAVKESGVDVSQDDIDKMLAGL
ncbi:MAG: response regulator [Magnetospirillum sp. WYHS-4]